MGELEEGLMKRFRDLEASQAKLREQLGLVLNEGRQRGGGGGESMARNRRRGEYDVVILPGYFAHNPYRSVLDHIGHAIHVCRPSTGEIIYWNPSAENLYGWKDYEALGQNVATLLIDEESRPFFEKVMERLKGGQTWSGQFPFRKRSGEMFMAIVTKSPLYENGELIGVITVSSDGAILDDMYSEKSKVNWNEARGQPRESKLNFKRINLLPQPQIASSVSNLASKIFPHNRANSNNVGENFQERCGCILEKENVPSEKPGTSASMTIFRFQAGLKAIEEKTYKYEETISKFSQQSKIAAKVFSKLHIRGNTNHFQESDKGTQTNSVKISETESSPPISPDSGTGSSGSQSYVSKNSLRNSNHIHRHFEESLSQNMKTAECGAPDFPNIPTKIVPDKWSNGPNKRIHCSDKGNSLEETRNGFSNRKQNNSTCLEQSGKKDDAQHKLEDFREGLLAQATLRKKHTSQQKVEDFHNSTLTISVGTNGSSQAGTSPVGEKELNSVTDCDIHWEDLHLGEEIGQGSSGVVYRGVWNGSDVAIKVYLGKDYQEGLLLDYKKEIAIMKRLRHPNVLLFMGAAASPDRLAIVTEFLPRGSLFRTLHNNQKLDPKRRLRMALDVARGMNYLHRRNPPIIHRDLKSSNLLVDKNWTVKVGDFGLSCLKISTVLTTTSARGTPQWMAPEVLRGECTNEKSDVFSFGVILWELMTESIPWCHLDPLQVIGVVGFVDRRLDLPAGMDPRISSIICDCWESDPGRRPSFHELVGRMAELTGAMTPTFAHRRSGHQMRGSPQDC